jgi:hypothetical protein
MQKNEQRRQSLLQTVLVSSSLKLLSIPPHKRDRELWTWICSRRHTRFVFLPFPALPSSYLGTEEKKRVRVGSAKEMWRRRQTTTKRTMMMMINDDDGGGRCQNKKKRSRFHKCAQLL